MGTYRITIAVLRSLCESDQFNGNSNGYEPGHCPAACVQTRRPDGKNVGLMVARLER